MKFIYVYTKSQEIKNKNYKHIVLYEQFKLLYRLTYKKTIRLEIVF